MADVLTQVGEEHIIDQIDAFGAYYCAWGTGAGTAAKGDTALFTEASESRVATTDSQPAADQIQHVATITADGAKTITNVGIFTLASGGILTLHSDHTGQLLALGDKIEYTITLEQT